MGNKIGIYIHLPFCARKCPYCDFYSVGYSKDKVKGYIEALCLDMASFGHHRILVDTIYFGGGTPSLLTGEQLSFIIANLKSAFLIDEEAEISLEANPNTLNEKRLFELLNAGINRLSIGVQSFNDKELTALGRLHSGKKAFEVISLAKRVGFKSVSVDIMLGTPYQTAKTLGETLDLIAELPIDHVSAYMLTVEEKTEYYNSELLSYCVSSDELADMYLQVIDRLEEGGLLQYEISNFAKKGDESRHNLKYWRGTEYIGFGASAHSYFNSKRFCNPDDIDSYIKNGSACSVVTQENPADSFEWLMLRLRLCEGVDMADVVSRFSDENFFCKLEQFKKGGLIESCRNNGGIRLTKKGMLVSNSVISELLG